MKGYAIAKRDKPTDPLDIYYCARNYPGGVEGLVSDTMPFLQVDAAKTGYRHIASKFRTDEDYGPTRVREFVEGSTLLGPRTPDQCQQDASGKSMPGSSDSA